MIAHHHDNFFLPLDEPMGFSFNVNFGGFAEEVRRVSADLDVRVFDPLQSIQATQPRSGRRCHAELD